MYSWKLPSEDDFIAGLDVLIDFEPTVPTAGFARDSFMLPPPCCFRSKLENCRLSTEHHTFSPLSRVIQ